MLDLHRLDQRTAAARIIRDRVAALTTSDPITIRDALAKRAAFLEMAVESTEAALARGERVNVGQHAAAVGELRKVLAELRTI